MLNSNKLRGRMAECGYTQAQVAKAIGMSETTFSRKMNNGKFGITDAEKMIVLLKIENPCEIFFAQIVT